MESKIIIVEEEGNSSAEAGIRDKQKFEASFHEPYRIGVFHTMSFME